MRTTVNLDEELIEEARRITGTRERTALIHEGLRALIERESARRLARLGGAASQVWGQFPGGAPTLRDPGRYLRLDGPSALG